MTPPAGYSGTPLVRKLGIKPATRLALVGAPDGFVAMLDGMPESVQVLARVSGRPELVVWFVASRLGLERRIPAIARQMGQGLWIAWPKKSSGVASDLTEDVVRAAGLAHGLVDYKVCAIDGTWSGLKFARRSAGSR